MLPNWQNRPEVTANLINPAFCNAVMRECIIAYKTEKNEHLPYAFSMLVLPIILTSRIRNRLPKTKVGTIHSWINSNEDLKVGLANHISSFIPFYKGNNYVWYSL